MQPAEKLDGSAIARLLYYYQQFLNHSASSVSFGLMG